MTLDKPDKIFPILKTRFNPLQEEVWVLTVDPQLNLLEAHLVFRGTLNLTLAHLRDIFRTVLTDNSYGFFLAHNHPSGHQEPSPQDIHLTRRVQSASDLLEVEFLDHFVFTQKTCVSIKSFMANKSSRNRRCPL
jgi:DNA repair protein RadC